MDPVKVRVVGAAVELLLLGLRRAAGSVVGVQGEWWADEPGASYAEVQLRADDRLLAILACWQELGLLSVEQVRRLCAVQLSCPVPTRVPAVRAASPPPPPKASQPVRAPSLWVQELGTVWLLWLGVFSIGVSATALVISRWTAIAPAGQALVLLASTWFFWGLGRFVGRDSRLPLTTKALATVPLGLLPLNVWGVQALAAPLWAMGLALGTLILVLGRSGLPRRQQVALAIACGSHAVWGVSPWAALHGGVVAGTVGGSWTGAIAVVSLLIRGFLNLPSADLGLALAGLGLRLEGQRWRRGAATWLTISLLWMGLTEDLWAIFWVTLAIGCLGLWRWARLRRPRDVVFPFFWNLAIAAVVWGLLPSAWTASSRRWLMDALDFDGNVALMTIGWLAYTAATGLGVAWGYRRGYRVGVLAKLALGLWALGLSLLLSVPLLRLAYLLVGAIAGLIWVGWRAPVWPIVIYGVQGLFWGLFLTLWEIALPHSDWAVVLVMGTLLAWLGAWRGPRIWQQSLWVSGAIAAAVSLVWVWSESWTHPGLFWLAIPVTLTLLATRPDFVARSAAVRLGAIAALLAPGLLWVAPDTRLLGFGAGWLLMLVLARQEASPWIVHATVGCGLGFVGSLLAFRPQETLVAQAIWGGNGLVACALLLMGLSQWLQYRRERAVPTLNLPLNLAYTQALDFWGGAIAVGLIAGQTLLAFPLWQGSESARTLFLGWLPATALIFASTLYRRRLGAIPWGDGVLAGCLEIGAMGAVVLSGGSLFHLAIANAGLGWLSQTVGAWRSSWVPLGYSTLSTLLRWGEFNALTGLLTANTALAIAGVARQETDNRWLAYLAIAGSSLAAYETVFGSLAGAGGSPGDSLVIGAGISLSLAASYRLGTRWLISHFRLSPTRIAYLHAGFAVLCLALNWIFPPSRWLAYGGMAIALMLLAVFWVERRVYLWQAGMLALVFYGAAFALREPWPSYWYEWGAAVVTAIALLFSCLPWADWDWPTAPWQQGAVLWPLTAIALTAFTLNPWAWLICGLLYGLGAWYHRNLRFTYLTGSLTYIAFWQGVPPSTLTTFYRAALFILLLLYLSHSEQQPPSRGLRHHLRLWGGSLIALWSIVLGFTAENWALPWLVGGLGAIAGLSLQVRAYLVLGTATWMLTAIGQTINLVSIYGFLLWAIGLVAGIAFIAIAANLERQRDRWPEFFAAWQTLWDTWD